MLIDAHCGTHLDAPLHMLDKGETIDKFDLNLGFVKCRVVDLTAVDDKISETDLKNRSIAKGDYILLKTKNSFEDFFNPEFIYVDESGARYLKEQKIIGVGIDSVGIERSQPGHETHKILLDAGITILEGLRLKNVEEDQYSLIALPLKIRDVEASPVRAILIKED
jgi:arylformamidase